MATPAAVGTGNREGVEQRPDGRKCLTCRHKDDAWDPVIIKLGRKVYMWWAKPPDKITGERALDKG